MDEASGAVRISVYARYARPIRRSEGALLRSPPGPVGLSARPSPIRRKYPYAVLLMRAGEYADSLLRTTRRGSRSAPGSTASDRHPEEMAIPKEVQVDAPETLPQGSHQRLRVLHVVTRFLRGGSERRVLDFVRSFPEADHHLVLGPESDIELARERIAPASLSVLPSLIRRPAPVKDQASFVKLVWMLRRNRYDLLVTHQSKAGVLGRTAAWVAGDVPTIHSLSMANFGAGYPRWQDAVFRRLESRLERVTSAYVVVGHDLAARYRAIGVPETKLHVVRSGISLPGRVDASWDRAAVCRKHALPVDRPLVLYLGSLESRKNVLDLVPFLERLTQATDGIRPHLAVAGEGPLADRLLARVRAAGLTDDVSLLGYVSEPEELVRAADALVLLSSAEGVPQVLVQAMAAGTPFVAYAVDGVRELLDAGADGAVVPLGDVSAASHQAALLMARGRRAPNVSIDLSSWSSDAIREGHRRVIGSILPGDLRPVGS